MSKEALRTPSEGKLLSQKQVMEIWPISREFLSKLTNHPNPAKRIPSYRFGKKPMYDFQELMWYREKFRYTPKDKRGGKR